MHRSTLECLKQDQEVMNELQERLTKPRKKFPHEDEVKGGKATLSKVLEDPSKARQELDHIDLATSEAIVISVGRPSLLIQKGVISEVDSDTWKTRLNTASETLKDVIPSVGRVELSNHPDFEWIGTAWMIDEGILITNRHVAQEFAQKQGNRFVFRKNFADQTIGARVDFLEEYQRPDAFEINIAAILYIAHSGNNSPDLAFLRIKPSGTLPPPISLAEKTPGPNTIVGVLGYPARDSRNSIADASRIFRDIYNVKRFAPGLVTATEHPLIFSHDCTTLGGNSGSPVVELETGKAVGLHFSGRYGISNYAVKVEAVKESLRRARPTFSIRPLAEEEKPRLDSYQEKEGYRPNFLGGKNPQLKVALPELKPEQKTHAYKVKPKARGMEVYALDYTHFSVVMNTKRRLAFYTAVNIDGNEEVKLNRSRETWQFDPRIPEEFQAGNQLYANNQLDKGHLVRRLDPVWGSSSEAKQAEKDTFHYTNAAPQHAHLNQRTWLSLEDYILGNANAQDLKVSVFTGPVFSDNDPKYRGFHLPQEFWKVVVMVTPEEKLHATAYLLSQSQMLDDLEFVFGQHRTYQVPVTIIEEKTGLLFGELRNFDPLASTELEIPLRLISNAEDIIL